MGKYRLEITENAKKDLQKHRKTGNKAILNKIDKIYNELKEHPYTGTGKPEPLKHELKGLWSRRINLKDRLIYEVHEDIVTVYVLSALGHCDDK
ncbi:MAG: Txe/YoeB family addiction module toxin [Flavobacterium sp.]